MANVRKSTLEKTAERKFIEKFDLAIVDEIDEFSSFNESYATSSCNLVATFL